VDVPEAPSGSSPEVSSPDWSPNSADSDAMMAQDMGFEPDIIVTSGDGSEFMMVVETKWHEHDLSKAEAQLKAYMSAVRSPVGLLVTPNQLRIFRDRYLPFPDISVEEVGTFDVSELLARIQKTRDGTPHCDSRTKCRIVLNRFQPTT
jgi:hypothetical protein